MVKCSVTHFKMQKNVGTTTSCDTFVTSTCYPLLQVMVVTHLLLSSLLSVPKLPKQPANTVSDVLHWQQGVTALCVMENNNCWALCSNSVKLTTPTPTPPWNTNRVMHGFLGTSPLKTKQNLNISLSFLVSALWEKAADRCGDSRHACVWLCARNVFFICKFCVVSGAGERFGTRQTGTSFCGHPFKSTRCSRATSHWTNLLPLLCFFVLIRFWCTARSDSGRFGWARKPLGFLICPQLPLADTIGLISLRNSSSTRSSTHLMADKMCSVWIQTTDCGGLDWIVLHSNKSVATCQMSFPPVCVDCVESVFGPFTGEQAGKYGGVNEALGYKGEEGSSLMHIKLRFQR